MLAFPFATLDEIRPGEGQQGARDRQTADPTQPGVGLLLGSLPLVVGVDLILDCYRGVVGQAVGLKLAVLRGVTRLAGVPDNRRQVKVVVEIHLEAVYGREEQGLAAVHLGGRPEGREMFLDLTRPEDEKRGVPPDRVPVL